MRFLRFRTDDNISFLDYFISYNQGRQCQGWVHAVPMSVFRGLWNWRRPGERIWSLGLDDSQYCRVFTRCYHYDWMIHKYQTCLTRGLGPVVPSQPYASSANCRTGIDAD